MFGYIRPFKPELKIREYETYKAVYCGVCRQLGKSYGVLARLTLSYDFTFLCMLHAAVSGEPGEFVKCRCCVNPLKQLKMFNCGEAQRYSADIAAIMLYYKVLDNIQDSGKFKGILWRACRPLAASARKKAALARPLQDAAVAKAMELQRVVEEKNSPSIDEACEPSAAAMAEICRCLSQDAAQQRVLERIGYLVGRFVYLCDALDDLEKDMETGNYNPFASKYGIMERTDGAYAGVLEQAKSSLLLTAGEIGRTWELLEQDRFEDISANIVFLGLQAAIEEILAKKESSK